LLTSSTPNLPPLQKVFDMANAELLNKEHWHFFLVSYATISLFAQGIVGLGIFNHFCLVSQTFLQSC